MSTLGGPLLGNSVTAMIFTLIPVSPATAELTASPRPPEKIKKIVCVRTSLICFSLENVPSGCIPLQDQSNLDYQDIFVWTNVNWVTETQSRPTRCPPFRTQSSQDPLDATPFRTQTQSRPTRCPTLQNSNPVKTHLTPHPSELKPSQDPPDAPPFRTQTQSTPTRCPTLQHWRSECIKAS